MKLSPIVKFFFFRVINMKVLLSSVLLIITVGALLAQGTGHRAMGIEQGAQRREQKIPGNYDQLLSEAVKLQHNADSILRIANWVRKETQAAPAEKQEEMKLKAEGYEKRAAARQAEADSVFLEMEKLIRPVSEAPDTTVKPVAPHLLSVFEIKSETVYGSKNPIPSDTGTPEGLVYRIQLAAFRNLVQPSIFRGLYPLYMKKKAETGVMYYYAGLFRKFDDARQNLPKVKTAGFPDAFIVAMMNDTQVSLERAALLEKEWASKPLYSDEDLPTEIKSTMVPDTLPVGTLMFRTEVLRSRKPVKPEIIEKMQILAGSRGLDMIRNKEGETVFLIGNFITFESADEYVSLLIRNGYSNARVAAYVGMHEIPVEAARELLNKL